MIRIAITPAAYAAIAGTLSRQRRQRDRPAGHPAKPCYRRAIAALDGRRCAERLGLIAEN